MFRSDELVTPERLARLARRITWLDRTRRLLAIPLAALASYLIIRWFAHQLSPEWPGAHLAGVGIIVTFFTWYGIEVFLGFLVSLWETDYAAATRPPGLPRAAIVKRK